MEPHLPAPHGSPELGPHMPQPEQPNRQGGEVYRGAPERHDESREQQTGQGSGDTPPPQQAPVSVPIPIMPDPTATPQSTQHVVADAPSVAADDDVIEKEWVEKAKKVIAETKHDPYLQEQAVSRLQADYLQKRYGKSIKLPDEG